MKRVNQVILIATFIPSCWLAFMAVHELGHIVAGRLSGGTVTQVVVHPFAVSRTDVFPNPHPLLVVWAGPMVGCLAPLLVWGTFRMGHFPGAYLPQFFAGFCLIGNGAYIGIGSIAGIGDAREMLQHGSPIWLLWLFGLATAPVGLLMWNGLGPEFGLGESNGRVDPRAAYSSLALFLVLFTSTFLLSPRF